MHPLLKRQIRKYLDPEIKQSKEIKLFLEAIHRSYQNHEEQFGMLQRAMSISSQELFEANKRLQEEAEEQKKVIASLTEATKALQSIPFKNDSGNTKGKELTGVELATLIEKQAFQISEIEKQREILLKTLEKSNQDLNDYAHVVSHDLKSPLRSMNALITWLKEDYESVLDQEAQKSFDMLLKKVDKMDHLINGILKYASVDRVEHKVQDIDLNDIVRDIIDIIHVPGHIQISIETELPIICCNKFRLQQLFQNLLNNALKYNDKEKGWIKIGCEEKEKFWQFYIADNGPGISKKYHEKIFKIFQTLDNKKESTGVGLSIVKKIVDLCGGKIWIESQEGLGTTFFFTLKK